LQGKVRKADWENNFAGQSWKRLLKQTLLCKVGKAFETNFAPQSWKVF
jgi:hypothetical protein